MNPQKGLGITCRVSVLETGSGLDAFILRLRRTSDAQDERFKSKSKRFAVLACTITNHHSLITPLEPPARPGASPPASPE
jgi:hypothetical protein